MSDETPRGPQEDPQTMEMIAEEIGVTPDQIELPAQPVAGLMIFEMDDGTFGFRPITPTTGLLDMVGLIARAQIMIQADAYAEAQIKKIDARLAKERAEARKPQLVVPTAGRRRR